MKNLEKINPAFARPNTFCANSALVPLFLSGFSFILALDAAPSLEFYRNPLCLLCGIICLFSAALLIIPRIFRWDWNVKYFGFSMIYLGSVALIGGIPWCCIFLYSTLPNIAKTMGFTTYLSILIIWSQRFLKIYSKILVLNNDNFGIYREDNKAFYYLQKVDIKVLKKQSKFDQFPRSTCILFFISAAFAMIPFSGYLKTSIGLPFIHIFLAIAAIPTDMMAIGLFTRGLIIFYYKPMLIYRKTGKSVYIDMAST